MQKRFMIQLDDHDLFQLLDGLEMRAESWERPAEYLRTEKMPEGEFFLIEECSKPHEADDIPHITAASSQTFVSRWRHRLSTENRTAPRAGFCIYVNTFCQGSVPVVSDETGYIVFNTELEAQQEIVDHLMMRLEQFLCGEREFEDAITVEEYVVPVTVQLNGTITDEKGNSFGRFPE